MKVWEIAAGALLGLAIVKRLVNLMAGNIAVESKLGKGTRITVKLPASKGRGLDCGKKFGQKPLASEKNERLAGNILLAEDNKINSEIAERMLESMGLKVELAENGEEAVNMFRDAAPAHYDAILMDIQMPKKNGFEATKDIRALAQTGKRSDAGTIPIMP